MKKRGEEQEVKKSARNRKKRENTYKIQT
jgi:hypothetical protein